MPDSRPEPNTQDWRSTRLWLRLAEMEDSTAREAKRAVEACMALAVPVLATGGTSPTDFTLHDAGHSFRVAERMAEVIADSTLSQLKPYDLVILLLSAYLHDIGMTPQQGKVTRHHDFLLTGDEALLPEAERSQFQRWLDDDGRGIVPPLCEGQPKPGDLRLARELITHYCRYKHNDWSEDWIRQNLSRVSLGTYTHWLEDLVAVCRSHQQGYHELISDRFDPRPVGSPSQVVHPRYLAVALRVADVMEFDPKRTPDVILRHRDVSNESLVYWWKDHEIAYTLDGRRVVISARPPDAKLHRAIELTCDAVDTELQLACTLAAETHFDRCRGLTVTTLPHTWDLAPRVHRTIAPLDNAYEYIDGAFRPDTEKLLELFSGMELYGSEMVAVRELLQNAFDAVKEQIAYERLRDEKPAAKKHEESLGRLHKVELRVEPDTDEGRTWLVCRDSGVGMTKQIITDHLLVCGKPRRHDVLDLERKCEKAGFRLGRTGQFGIGVLSYFMLADRLVIKTRRSQSPGDAEPNGWHFESEGVGSFGELRRDESVGPGTEVRLRLRPVFVEDLSEFYKKLKVFLENTLVRVPCRFEIRAPNRMTSAGGPRWTMSEADGNLLPRSASWPSPC